MFYSGNAGISKNLFTSPICSRLANSLSFRYFIKANGPHNNNPVVVVVVVLARLDCTMAYGDSIYSIRYKAKMHHILRGYRYYIAICKFLNLLKHKLLLLDRIYVYDYCTYLSMLIFGTIRAHVIDRIIA